MKEPIDGRSSQRQPLPAVVELRQYTLHPGRRDELIELFEREFIEPQEACGMRLLGLFQDAADPDRFVWLRGFASMARRADALSAFYDGPVSRAHREAANATMVDSDDVRLLRPCFALPEPDAPGRRPDWQVIATVCPLRQPAGEALRQQLADRLVPALRAAARIRWPCWRRSRRPIPLRDCRFARANP